MMPEEALLVWLGVYHFSDIKEFSASELAKSITALWPEIRALTHDEPIEVKTEPATPGHDKGLLSKILGVTRSVHLNVAFIYAYDPNISEWTTPMSTAGNTWKVA